MLRRWAFLFQTVENVGKSQARDGIVEKAFKGAEKRVSHGRWAR